MPRIFMSVLTPQRGLVALRRDGAPADRLARGGALGEPGEGRQDDEVLDRQQQSAEDAGDGAGEAQVRLPERAETRPPELRAVARRRDADELRERVVHSAGLVVYDAGEDALR